MTVTFQYEPLKLEALANVNGYKNVLHKVTWQLTAFNEENLAVSKFVHVIPFKQKEPFIELTALTDDQIMQWVLDEIHPSDLNAMRNGLAANLAAIK